MKEFSSFLEFIIDIFCIAIPIDEDFLQSIPKSIPIIICFVAVAIFWFSSVQKIISDILKGKKFIALLIAACVIILSFALIDIKEWTSIFYMLYIPLIFIIRGIEGVLIGTTFKLKVWIWILIPIFIILLILYILLSKEDRTYLSYFVLIWTISGIIFASYRWSKLFKEKSSFSVNSLSIIALFFIFFATLIYIPNYKVDKIIYLLMFPIGFILGIIFKK